MQRVVIIPFVCKDDAVTAIGLEEKSTRAVEAGPATAVGPRPSYVRPLSWRVTSRRVTQTFADRLNRLFDTVYPPHRGPHTSAELINALKSQGVRISAPYLSQLRSGARTNPSRETIDSIAAFFRISPAYFTDDWYFEIVDKELAVLAAMRDQAVRRLANRVVGLSAEAFEELAARVEELRRAEDLS